MGELVIAPRHVVLDAERLTKLTRIAVPGKGEICQIVRRNLRLLRAERGYQPRGHGARIGRERADGYAPERGLPAAVVTEQAGPTSGEAQRDM